MSVTPAGSCLLRGEAHRLLDEDVQSRPGRLDGDGRMAAGREDKHGVHRFAEHFAPVGERLRHTESLRARSGVGWSDVAQDRDLVAI